MAIDLKINLDILKVIKKNTAMLLPVGLAVGAVLVFIPVYMLNSSIKNEMQASVGLAGQVSDLANRAVAKDQFMKEQEVQAAHEKDANNVEKLAMRTSMRELLVYDIFPEPNETSAAIFTNFGKVYRKATEGLVLSIGGRDCPSEEEIQEFTRQAGGAGQMNYSMGGSDKLIDQFCKDRASKTPVYANPEMFGGYSYWNEYNYVGMEKAVEDCWNSQLAYWVQKDVVDAIGAMNKGSSSVWTSPVKRLIKISFTGEYKPETSSGSSMQQVGVMDLPSMVGILPPGVMAPQGTTASALSYAWTGRKSDDTMEVTHFAFSVIISSKAVMPFMKELCSARTHKFKGWRGDEPEKTYQHNQITVLKSTIEPVVTQNPSMGGQTDRYRYGEDSIVQLNLVCEYVFNKAGYSQIKPVPKQPVQQ